MVDDLALLPTVAKAPTSWTMKELRGMLAAAWPPTAYEGEVVSHVMSSETKYTANLCALTPASCLSWR